MTMDRSELQRLYGRAVGNGRRYWADSHVQNLVTAVGDYLAQDDPAVEIAYLRATIADTWLALTKEQPQRRLKVPAGSGRAVDRDPEGRDAR